MNILYQIRSYSCLLLSFYAFVYYLRMSAYVLVNLRVITHNPMSELNDFKADSLDEGSSHGRLCRGSRLWQWFLLPICMP